MARSLRLVSIVVIAAMVASAVLGQDKVSPDNAHLVKAREVQNGADALRDEMTQKMLHLEEEYHNKQVPVFKDRNDALEKIPGFWLRVIENHPAHTTWLRGNDRDILSHVVDIRVEDTHPEGSLATQSHNFKIALKFGPNPYFSDAILWRNTKPGDEPATVSKINWATGQAPKEPSFFHLFENPPADESNPNFMDAHTINDMVHVIRYELWPAPFQFYDIPTLAEHMAQIGDGSEMSPDAYSEEVPQESDDSKLPEEDVHREHIADGVPTSNTPDESLGAGNGDRDGL